MKRLALVLSLLVCSALGGEAAPPVASAQTLDPVLETPEVWRGWVAFEWHWHGPYGYSVTDDYHRGWWVDGTSASHAVSWYGSMHRYYNDSCEQPPGGVFELDGEGSGTAPDPGWSIIPWAGWGVWSIPLEGPGMLLSQDIEDAPIGPLVGTSLNCAGTMEPAQESGVGLYAPKAGVLVDDLSAIPLKLASRLSYQLPGHYLTQDLTVQVCVSRSALDSDEDGLPDDVDLAPYAPAPLIDLGVPGGPPYTEIQPRLPGVAPGKRDVPECPSANPSGDSDGDGFSDVIEGAYASNPADANSTPVVPPGEIEEPLATEAPAEVDCNPKIEGLTVCELRPGDIILWKSDGALSALESFLGATHFTHAAMVVGRFRMKETQKIEVIVADITPNRGEDGATDKCGAEFCLSAIDDLIGDLPDEATHKGLGVYRPSRGRSERDAAARKLIELALEHGADADNNRMSQWWDAPGVDYPAVPPTGLPLPDAWGPASFYCSSLVAWAYDLSYGDFVENVSDLAVLLGWDQELYLTPDDLLGLIPSTFVTGFGVDSVIAGVFSPAHLLLTDPQGRRSGLGPDGVQYDEIPGASWRSEETNEGVSAANADGDWQITLAGYESGPYVLLTRRISGATLTRHAIVGYTRPGLVETYGFDEVAELEGRPAAWDDTTTVAAGATRRIDVLANDVDPDDDLDPASVTVVDLPGLGTATVSRGSILYTAPPGSPAVTTFTYQVCDAQERCTTAQVSVTVTGPTFADVPASNPFYGHIERLYTEGITTGCGTNQAGQRIYCPGESVPRQQMAAFLIRAKGLTPLASPTPTFADVPAPNPFYGHIERLYTEGITTGCGTNQSGQRIYCPGESVPRQQMAAFLIRAKGLTPLASPTPTFADVPASNPFYGHIERLYAEGITTGCGTNQSGQLIYCPGEAVPRQQMAAFLIRAFVS